MAVDGLPYTGPALPQPALPSRLPRLSALWGRWPSRTFLNLAVLLSTSGPLHMLFPLFEMLFPLNLSTNIISSGKAFPSLKLCQALLLCVPASTLYVAHRGLQLGICVVICLISASPTRTKAPGGQKPCLLPQLDACLPAELST